MADRAQDATGDAQIKDSNRTPQKTVPEKELQQKSTLEEAPKPKSANAPDTTAGAIAHERTKRRKADSEVTKRQPASSKPRSGRHRGRNRSKGSESSYNSTTERVALGRPNRKSSKPDRSQSNGVPITRPTPNSEGKESEADTMPETISGGRRKRQGKQQQPTQRVTKTDNFEVGGVVNGRPLNGTEKEKENNSQDKSDSESTAGSAAHSDGQAPKGGQRRNRRRKKGKNPQTNTALLPSITENHTGGETEERSTPHGTNLNGDNAEPSDRTRLRGTTNEKVEAKEEPLRLKLEFNMDIDIEIKAKISGDLTLNMYGKAEFGELKVQLDHMKF